MQLGTTIKHIVLACNIIIGNGHMHSTPALALTLAITMHNYCSALLSSCYTNSQYNI